MKKSDKEIKQGHFPRGGMPEELNEILKKISDIDPDDYDSYDRGLACCVAKLNQLRLEKSFDTKITRRMSIDRWLGIKPQDDPWGFFAKLDFLDHSYFTKHEGNFTLVGEPYGIDSGTLKHIIKFCETYNLYFYQSWTHPPIWFPNRTIALCFNKIDKRSP